MAARLLTLASGRVLLGPRLLVWTCLILLLGAWAVLDPGHRAAPRLIPAPPETLLLPPRSPWVERAELADPANLFLRAPSRLADVPVTAQPEATPFLAYGPDLRTQPGQPLGALPTTPKASSQTPTALLLKPDSYPLRTLGQVAHATPPTPRRPTCEVISDSGEVVFRLEITDDSPAGSIHKILSISSLTSNKPAEFRMGIDAFGLQAKPFLTVSSGDPSLDQAALGWAVSQPWARRLPPGSYRLRVGP